MLISPAPPRATSARAALRMRRVAGGFASTLTAPSKRGAVARRGNVHGIAVPAQLTRQRLLRRRLTVHEPHGRRRLALAPHAIDPALQLGAIPVRAVPVQHLDTGSQRYNRKSTRLNS